MNDKASKKSPPWQLIAIILVTVIPIAAAYIAYYTGVGVPKDHVNEGALLVPARNANDLLAHAQGTLPSFAQNRKWRLLIPVNGVCDAACETNLFNTRQVHIRLAQKAERVERYAVNIGGAVGAEFLAKIAPDQPHLESFSVDVQQWQQWLAGTNAPADINAQPYFLLVDQLGFAMMFYTADQDGNQLLKDLNRVLRYSPEQ
jgi:hypothetical protein